MANLTGCGLVHDFAQYSEDQCEFVVDCADCHRGEGFIPYIDIVYCAPYRPYLPLIALVCWCMYLFGVLAITANDYLCPSLVAISRKLGLSQAVAGVTFLAIGNGAPDIIASFTAINQDRSALVISELFGAGTFVTAVVGGYIFFSGKFTVDKVAFLRDVVFYMAASGLAFVLFKMQKITVYHAVLFVSIYAVYIALVLIRELFPSDKNAYDHEHCAPPPTPTSAFEAAGYSEIECLLENTEQKLRRPSGLNVHHQNAIKILLQQQNPPSGSPSSPVGYDPRRGSVSAVSPNSMISKEVVQRRRSVSTATATSYQSIRQIKENLRTTSDSDSGSENEPNEVVDERMSSWKELWIHIAPTSCQELESETPFNMAWRLLALPIQVCLALTVPVVDYEHEKDNWCKALNVLHCLTAPLAIATIVLKDLELFDVPIFVFVLPFGLVLAALVIISSKQEEAPRYHFGFALLAFVTAVCFIYAACRELMTILKAFGVSYNIDDSVLGLTVLAWGSSIGDMITDSTVAKQGYPAMAIAAAFGGPMLNLLIGFGLAFSAKLLQMHETAFTVEFPSILFVLYSALNCSLLVSVIFLCCNKFQSSTAHAITLWLLYGMFIVTALTITIHADSSF